MRYSIAFEPHLDSINNAFLTYYRNRKDVNFILLKKPQKRDKSNFFVIKAFGYRVKAFFMLNKYDIVHINSAKFGIIAYLASFFKCRYIYTIHFASDEERKGSLTNYLFWILEVMLLKLVARRALYVTAVSAYCADEVRRKYGISAKVIHNGYDEELFNDQLDATDLKRNLVAEGEPVFISVGRMIEYKKPLNIIKVFAKIKQQYPKAKLLLIGDGDQYEQVIASIKANHLDSDVITIKKIDFNLMPAYYHAADYFISACQTEALGLVCLESLACGAIPLVPWKGAFPEIFQDTNFSYNIDKLESLVLPDRQDMLTKRDSILKRFRWPEKVSLYDKLYQRILTQR